MRIIVLLILTLMAAAANAQNKKARHVIALIDSVQTAVKKKYQLKQNAWWDKAMYHTANMEAYRLTKKQSYLQYSIEWGKYNKWMGAQEANKSLWEYQRPLYDHINVMFADWQVCFQTYIDIYNIEGDKKMIARAIDVMEYQASRPEKDFWYWADALYMAMPVMTRMYHLTGNPRYLDKMYEWYSVTEAMLSDKETGLFFRDRKYVYPAFKSANGKKEFWSRGNGWVLAALARVLEQLPKDWRHYNSIRDKYIKMAYAIKERMQPDGYWTQNIEDPLEMPGYETTGTALYTYALAWGVNNGILSKKDFGQCISMGWKYLKTIALQPNYTIGYVQDWGEKAEPKFEISQKNQTIFGTGCWLLAAVEYCRYINPKSFSRNSSKAQ